MSDNNRIREKAPLKANESIEPIGDARAWNSEVAQLLSAMELHRADLNAAQISLHALEQIANGTIEMRSFEPDQRSMVAHTLYEGIIFAYCRCFDPSRQFRLDHNEVLKGKPKGLVAHRQVWALRSKHLAHDVNAFRSADARVVLSNDGNDFALDTRLLKMEPDRSVLANLARLVRDAAAYVDREISRLLLIVGGEVLAMSPEERRALPKLATPTPTLADIDKARPQPKFPWKQ